MRLIDADALLSKLARMVNYCENNSMGKELNVLFQVGDAVIDCPDIEAEFVVHCKDCLHWDCYGGEDSHKGDCLELNGLDSCMYEDDFCSYGERRTE